MRRTQIIRPPRATYQVEDLGPRTLRYQVPFGLCAHRPHRALGATDLAAQGVEFLRTDVELRNARGLTLRCSHWEPTVPPRLSILSAFGLCRRHRRSACCGGAACHATRDACVDRHGIGLPKRCRA